MNEYKGTTSIPLSDTQICGLCAAVSEGMPVKFHGEPFQMINERACQAIGIHMNIDAPEKAAARTRMIRKLSQNCETATDGLPSVSARILIDIDLPEVAILRINWYRE